MDIFIEDYDKHKSFIDLLWPLIESWESTADEFKQLNEAIAALDSKVSLLATLMDQHNLSTTDFKYEIGDKSIVSMILNGSKELSLSQVKNLCVRFDLPEKLFIS